MADRFPLIVNAISKKIEEIVAGDKLELTGNGIVIGGDSGAGKYLSSDGSTVFWDNPGDVYLNQTQTILNKTLETCVISGSLNTLTNIPNSALINPGININGTTISLGGTVTTPDNNTTYSISAADGTSASQKIIRLTSGGNSGGGVDDDIILEVASPPSIPSGQNGLNLSLSRVDDTISLYGTVVDNNTVTSITATGGSPQTGTVNFAGSGCNVTMDDASKTVTVTVNDQDTITNLKGDGGNLVNGDVTLLATSPVTIVQGQDGNGDPTFTFGSTDTITRVKGGSTGTFKSGDITIVGGTSQGGNTTVSSSPDGLTISIDSPNDDTITRLAGGASNALAAGDFRITASGDATLTTTSNAGVTSIDIGFVNTDTGAGLTASNGIVLSSSDFQLKNAGNLTDAVLMKWDGTNGQLLNSIIEDDGSTVTISGNLVVSGTNTVIDTQTLTVADPTIELRTGVSIVDGSGGIQVNRTTDANGTPVTYSQLQFYHTGNYWRVFDGSIAKPLVTTTDPQVLTQKTLNSPTFTGTPVLGTATATTINGLTISATTGGILTIANAKTFTCNNTITLRGTDGVNVDFGNGPGAGYRVAYTGDTLGAFAPTNSSQLQGIMTDATGVGGKLMFNASPVITTALQSTSGTFALLNSGPTTINAFGNATVISLGNSSGTTTINGNLEVETEATFGSTAGDLFTVNGVPNFDASDIFIRNTDTSPQRIGRGNGAVFNNTCFGHLVLNAVTTGGRNTAMGHEVLALNEGGADNVGYGYRALKANVLGNDNVAVGMNAATATDADGNTAVGAQSLYSNVAGTHNVCLGYFAGYNVTGTGNVLIGPADTENDTSVTYQPTNPSADRQLVIGSGTLAWITGQSSGNVILPQALTVGGDATIQGNLTVNGTTTTLNTTTLSVDDRNIELAATTSAVFNGDIVTGTQITNVSSIVGLDVGMELTSGTGDVIVNPGTYITSIGSGVIDVSQTITTTGNSVQTGAVFVATGPTELGAEGGGLIVKGSTDHTILYEGTGVDKFWALSENLKFPAGKKIVLNNALLLDATTLGSTVVNSSLTSVGTLGSLSVSGNVTFAGRITEGTLGGFATTVSVPSNVYTISVAGINTFFGTTPATPINTWDFTNVNLDPNQSVTITLILAANTAATYGDACEVDGTAIANGIQWSGGSPPLPSSNTDILTFIIAKDSSGTTKVFGQGNTDFS